MKHIILFYMVILISCSSNQKTAVMQNESAPNIVGSLNSKAILNSIDTFSGSFIRPPYYSEIQNNNVNSWPGKPDTSGMFSAEISCKGKGNKFFIIYNNNGEIVQTGKLKDKSYECGTEYKSNFIDMNFDGFPDFKVNYEMGATGNSWDEYWLFNPADQNFHYNVQLSELVSTIPYPREKRVEAYWRSGIDYQSLDDYEWNGGTLSLVKREIINTDSAFAHQIYEKKNGKLIRTKEDNIISNIRD